MVTVLLLIMAESSCPVCVKSVLDTEKGIGCDGDCARWFHSECVKMPSSEYNKLAGDDRLKWHCLRTDCLPPALQPINSTLSTLEKLLNKMSAIDSKLNSLLEVPDKIDKIQENISVLNNKLDGLETRLTCTEDRIIGIETRVAALEDLGIDTSHSSEGIIAEINDRSKRAFNAILHNVPESSSSSAKARVECDTSHVVNILETFMPNESAFNYKCTRIGKANKEKPRPLKVIFENTQLPRLLSAKFRQDDLSKRHPELSAVSISFDRTEKERKHLQCLRAELQARTSKGEKDITIRYVNGIPVISKLKAKNV